MKIVSALLVMLPLTSCALPTTVQRIGVEYNSAVAGMTNEVVVLNILRAKESLPLHYTALSRATGAVTIKATTGFNAAVKADGITDGLSSTNTGQTTTGIAAAGASSSVVNTAVNGVTSMIARGANVYTPSIGGEVDSGPSFDVAILNDQKFYQGILGAVGYSTVDNLISQGFDEELVLRLLVNRVTFRLAKANTAFTKRKVGEEIMSIGNAPGGTDARSIAETLACFTLTKETVKPTTAISRLDRFTHDRDGAAKSLDLKDLAIFDGKQFDVSRPIGAPADDTGVTIQRPGTDTVVAKLRVRRGPLSDFGPPPARSPADRDALPGECYVPQSIAEAPSHSPLRFLDPEALPKAPPPDAVFTQAGNLYVPADGTGKPVRIDVDMQVTFRSTEGVIRFVGDYLRAAEHDAAGTYMIRGLPVFTLLRGGISGALASATVLGQRWSVPNDDAGRRDMQIIAIIEQLINLQKSADSAPQTVPVRVVPGG